MASGTGRTPLMRPRRAGLAIVVIGVVIGLVVVVLVSGGGPGSAMGSSTHSGAGAVSQGAATVTRRDLVATDTESGTLGYAASQTVYNRLTGTITSLPNVGAVVTPGQTLYTVDEQPVVLFDGTTPAYRALGPDDTDGPDILELNRNLVRLGFDPERLIALDDVWQQATTDAVVRWQGSEGLTETGTITLGQIVFLPGAQRVTAVDTVLGSTGQSSGASDASALTNVMAHSEFVGLTTTSTTSTQTTSTLAPSPATSAAVAAAKAAAASAGQTAATLSALQALLSAETRALKQATAKSSSSSAKGSTSGAGGSSAGGGAAPAEAILQTASTKIVVSVQLPASNQSEAIVGEPVTVELPSGRTVDGRVTQVSPVAQSSSSGSGSGSGNAAGGGSGSTSATIPVTVTLTGHHPSLVGLDAAAVSVNFVAQQARHVLSVPVTALLATAGGGYDVQEAAAPHGLIPITPGLFAAGYVQISGAGIYPGLQVTDSQG